MFPWIDGFHWTPTHIIFLSLFGAALSAILATAAWGLWRTLGDFRKHLAAATCWRENFGELPAVEKRCRHELAGRLPSRQCDHAFDCRTCPNYDKFAALPANVPASRAGVSYSDNLLYHRGHTWVRGDWDGTFAIGLDEFAKHLVGSPESVKLPEVCDEVESEGIAWTMIKNGHKIRVRSPLAGTVISTGGPDSDFYLKILPHSQPNLRHLLKGPEVAGWLAAEVDRLQMQMSKGKATLADGGTMMPDLMDAILESTFIDR
jgi:Glycine cleavage H-protein